MGGRGSAGSKNAPVKESYSISGWRASTTTAAKMLEAIDNGAEISYVAGRFGGYMLNLGKDSVEIRSDWARKAIKDGKLTSSMENRIQVYRKRG